MVVPLSILQAHFFGIQVVINKVHGYEYAGGMVMLVVSF